MNSRSLIGGQYRPLSEKQIRTIHESSLTILEKIGVTYESGLDETLDILERRGASLDRDRSRILFPRDLVLEEVARAPEQVVLYSRDGQNDLDLGDDRVHLGTGGAALLILDLETGQARPTTLKDNYQIARLVNRLDHIRFFLRPCIPRDIPEEAYDINTFYACLKGTTKHVMSGVTTVEGLHQVLDLASIIAGDMEKFQERPFISLTACFAISPLKLCTLSTLIMQEAARHRIPVALSSAPMAGATSPITMAGTLAQLHAELLAGIVICQAGNPGAPLLYGGIPGMANLHSMDYLGGAVECGMMNAAIHQLAKHVKIPNYNSSGLTDSKTPDAQAGWEKAMSTLLTAMGGSNYVHHAAGMLESMLAVAYEQYVIDDEIIGMACKVLKGISVDDEHLALDVIQSVGPGGNYLTATHTVAHMRDEFFSGNGVTNRSSRDEWSQEGSKDTQTRARDMVRKILAEDERSCIPEDVDRVIREKFEIRL